MGRPFLGKIKYCVRCSKEMRVCLSAISRGKGKYCSRECENEGKKVLKVCDCGKNFFTHQSLIDQGKGKHCSRKCYELSKCGKPSWNRGKSASWAIGNTYRLGKSNPNPHKMFGEDNPRWEGGITVGEMRKDYFRFKNNERRVRRHLLTPHTLTQWQMLKVIYDYTCLACGRKEPEILLTRDHIAPLSLGGSDDISNIQPLCRSCNCKKWARTKDYRSFTVHSYRDVDGSGGLKWRASGS